MKSDLRRSAASSASLRSRSAVSMRKRSVTSAKVTRLAPSGRGERPSDRMVRSLRSTSPRSRGDAGFRDDGLDQPVPHRAVAELGGRQRGDGAHMRFALQLFRLEIPDAAESGIVQFQASIRSEHRHAFAQRVERRRLHLHQRVVVGLQSQLLADILVKESEAAEGMRLAHHPQGLAAGKVPIFLGGAVARGLIKRQPAPLPGLIVALLGKFAALAQPVEDFAVAGMTRPASRPEDSTAWRRRDCGR